jgi:GTPase SAR1 family protein
MRRTGDQDALAGYRRRKLELAEVIREGMRLAEHRHDQERVAGGRELLARLAEDRFQLAVVGQFSRGKSTLINAILGDAYLPTGALPITSVVTGVGYGSQPRAVVRRTETAVPIETTIEDLPRFVTQASAEREELGVASVEIQVPAEVLRLGFWFVDTPGVDSAIAANTATTRKFLPEADAVIFVTGFDAPLGEGELRFFDEVRRHVDRLFLVVNKLDLVAASEAAEVLRFVGERVAERAEARPRTFPVSARRGLEAKLQGDPARLAASGLLELERTLVGFLTGEKSKSFLLRTCDRAGQLLARLRFDVELGQAAQSAAASSATGARSFDDRIAELVRRQRTVVDDLRGVVRSRFPSALPRRTRRWPRELASLLAGALERAWQSPPGPMARNRVDETRTRLESSGLDLVNDWLTGKLPEVRALLIDLAGEHIGELSALKEAVERAAAEAFAVALPESVAAPGEWSSAELPPLGIGQVAVTVPLHLPWRLSVLGASRLESEGYRLLAEAVPQAAGAVADAAEHALVEAAARWVDDLGGWTERALADAADRVRARLATPGGDRDLEKLEEVERRLAAFRAEVAAWHVDAAAAGTEAVGAMQAAAPRTPGRTLSGCRVCERLSLAAFDFMARAQAELVTLPRRRDELVRSGGFCPTHTWQYAEIASDLGIALGYAGLAEAAGERLRGAERDGATPERLGASVARLLTGPERCPACLALAAAERATVRELLAEPRAGPGGGDPEVPALCVAHTAAVVAAAPQAEQASGFVRALADTLTRASEDMRTYSLKRESFRRQLLSDEEQTAYLQALSYLVGNRDLVRPWRSANDRHIFASSLLEPASGGERPAER